MIRDDRLMERGMTEVSKEGLPCLVFPSLEKLSCVEHLFTTRKGGVSRGDCATLNLSFAREENSDAVLENYRRVARALHSDVYHMVATKQTHTTNVRRVTEEDMGKGVVRVADYTDVDGLVTNIPGIILGVFTADCVPVYFVDPVHKAIGLAHSGWRGTVGGISSEVIRRMKEFYGTSPSDLICAIGPSICRKCYEISEEVAVPFLKAYENCGEFCEEIRKVQHYRMGTDDSGRIIDEGRFPGKYQLDLWLANAVSLRREGVLAENIQITDLCTCENSRELFSHRASHGRRGNLGAFLMLK